MATLEPPKDDDCVGMSFDGEIFCVNCFGGDPKKCKPVPRGYARSRKTRCELCNTLIHTIEFDV